jgi:uncharacterized membrane protein
MVPVFFVIDLIWLGVIARNMYKRYLGYLLSPDVNWIAAIVFYLIFIFGILFFAVLPALEKNSFLRAVVLGILFGGICYATYDLTNLATVKDWPLAITFIDIFWGMILTGSVSAAGYCIGKILI